MNQCSIQGTSSDRGHTKSRFLDSVGLVGTADVLTLLMRAANRDGCSYVQQAFPPTLESDVKLQK
ncbi:uncharacterized protein RAG0_12056 [Rhynchosporium agropyri]|uniref:Uncharacterized protein n=1 Tax=Rhynchosporium agropyri TaxID=914238 RepID=A0A1E1L6Z7_9HELO|nr:uncharacterized protein RAG0_12056 [Rhynchosporium agropyri]